MGLRFRSGQWHFVFQVRGQTHSGPTGCVDRAKAEAYEDKLKATIQGAKSEIAAIEAHRDALLQDSPLTFDKVALEYARSPDKHVGAPKAWQPFRTWLSATYPDVRTLTGLTVGIARHYATVLLQEGRQWSQSPIARKPLMPATVRGTINSLAAYIQPAVDNSGLSANVFRRVALPSHKARCREAFTEEQLRQIMASDCPHWVKHIVVVGSCTGLREGDICCLKWENISPPESTLAVVTRKTGAMVQIPMVPALRDWLLEIEETANWTLSKGEYVNPELAKRYLGPSRCKIGTDFGKALRDIGINTRDQQRRTVLDVHSLRHTFVYLAAMAGIPMPVVQSIVGHLTPAMTARYAQHATQEARRQAMAKLPDIFKAKTELPEANSKDIMISMLDNMRADNWTHVRDQLRAVISGHP